MTFKNANDTRRYRRRIVLLCGLAFVLIVLGTACNRDSAENTATATASPPPPPTASETPLPRITPLPPDAVKARILLPFIVLSASAEPDVPTPIAPPTTPTLPPTPTPEPCIHPGLPPPESSPPYVGLHASADPAITWQERCTFIELRPSIVKVQSFHPPTDIAALAATQPQARWIVRSFLEFGDRPITSAEFVEFTLSDTRRSLDVLAGRDVVVELHNEPNLVAEGMGAAWQDGSEFQTWYLDVLAQYRAALPGVRFLFPAVSPGGTIDGIRQEHISFLEQNRAAIEASDGLAVHVYWSAISPQQDALDTLDDIIGRFPNTPIWITESSYNKAGIGDQQRAREYLTFIEALKLRSNVQGITFFVASAHNPTFEPETWVGKSIAPLVGNRVGD